MSWQEPDDCKQSGGDDWVVGGDFNMVLRREEKSGISFLNAEAMEFHENLYRLGLMDVFGWGTMDLV